MHTINITVVKTVKIKIQHAYKYKINITIDYTKISLQYSTSVWKVGHSPLPGNNTK